MFTTLRFLFVVCAALSIAACDTIPARDRDQDAEAPAEPTGGIELIPLEDYGLQPEFDVEEEPEDLFVSIETDLRDGLDSAPPRRQTAYLDAAGKLIDAGRLEDAEVVLDSTDVSGLAPALAVRKRVLQADILFHRDDLDRAYREATRTLGDGNIDPSHIARALDIKGRIELRQGRPLEAARSWIRRDNYLTDAQALVANHQRIWYALGHLNQLDLQLAEGGDGRDALRGWLDLAILFLEFGEDRDGLRTAVNRWRSANRSHPAAEFAAIVLGPNRLPDVRRVGLLLPLTSEYGPAARQVYDGFDAAHGTDTHPRRPQVVFYDIGGEPSLIGNYAGVASNDGADVIVGPLGKSAVNALMESRQPDKPMVVLGSSDNANALTPGVFQFDLAPEPEAQQVAEFMYAAGHRRVAALYPEDGWGQRIHEAFVERWQELGGTLAEVRQYQPGSNDFTAPIKELFNLTESETRQSLLEASSGLNVEFDARRRRDIDALFLVARPDAARLLKPQIDFFQGHDLPVYSTSHVYAGSRDADLDTDLDGITFPDMPWVLRDTVRINGLKTALRDAGYSNVTSDLFAFGFDAYQLAMLAPDPGLTGNTRLSGLTADLVLSANGHIQRRFDWAEFKAGVPVRVWND